jgi:type III secretion system low calcium response chaperone LcrH/SycD
MDKKLKVKDLIDPEQLNQHLPEINEFFEQGGTWQLLMGITSAELELHYTQAYEAYSAGKLETATALFTTLSMMNPYEQKYWFGLGATKQLLQEYEAAIVAYTIAGILDEANPTPHFHAGQCHYALQDGIKCVECLEKAITCANGQEQYRSMIDEAERLMRSVNAKH